MLNTTTTASATTASTIRNALAEKYVFSEDVCQILSLAFQGKKFVILYGPGGHAKSEMVNAIIEKLGLKDDTFVQFFGEGMDESRLFGGLDFGKLENEHVLEYFPERSFLNYRVAVFEELFDAPANVLLALKDVLTSKELRNGAQRFPMKTEVILCLTNKEPAEIADLGPAAQALIERFPLQMRVAWPSYEQRDYYALFTKACGKNGPQMGRFASVLAEVIANATASGNFVSPRTAVKAYEVCQDSAAMNGRDEVVKEDLLNLRFIPGLEGLAESLQAEIAAAVERQKGEAALSECSEEYEKLLAEYEAESRVIQLMQISKRASALLDGVSAVRVPDSLTAERKALREKVQTLADKAATKAMANVRV